MNRRPTSNRDGVTRNIFATWNNQNNNNNKRIVYMKQVSKIVEIRQGEPVDCCPWEALDLKSGLSVQIWASREVLWKHFSTVWRLSACQSPGCKWTVSPVPTCGTHLALWEMLCQQKGDASIHGTDEIEHPNKKARPIRGDVEGSDGSGNGVFFLPRWMWWGTEAILGTPLGSQPDCCWVPVSHCVFKGSQGSGPVHHQCSSPGWVMSL